MQSIRTGLFVSALALSFAAPLQAAETYTLDPAHTEIGYRINHFGFSSPSGKFASVTGTLTLDEQKPEASKVTATITIANLFTGIEKLNTHLLSKDFFDATQFPTATFTSTKVDVTGKDTAKVTGDLTLHGVTKSITLDVTLNKLGENMMHKKTAGFTAMTILRRSDFGISAYVPNLADEVQIHIESEANLAE